MKCLPHISHWKGFSPVWKYLCSMAFVLTVKALSQISHLYFVVPSWALMCISMWYLEAFLKSHKWQLYLWSSLCSIECMAKATLFLYVVLHRSHSIGSSNSIGGGWLPRSFFSFFNLLTVLSPSLNPFFLPLFGFRLSGWSACLISSLRSSTDFSSFILISKSGSSRSLSFFDFFFLLMGDLKIS